MYPGQELKDLARLRKERIRSIELRRMESYACICQIAKPLNLLDWAVCEWRSTRAPASCAMIPVKLILQHCDQSKLKTVQRVLQGALFVLALAKQLDQISSVQKNEETSK
jgi:hypothetical protein